jgi:hypothetical protein
MGASAPVTIEPAISSHKLKMGQRIEFLAKIIGISTGVAIAIKYGAPYLHISPSTTSALTIVLLPNVVLAMLLGWQAWNHARH